MRKQKWVINLMCVTLLTGWGYFCATEVPRIQQQQREKVSKEVVAILKENQRVEANLPVAGYTSIIADHMENIVIDNQTTITTFPIAGHTTTVTEHLELHLQENSAEVIKEAQETEDSMETVYIEDFAEFDDVQEASYSESEVHLLARLIEAEGGITNYQCKLYIGSVVLNRMASDKYPNTLKEVIFDRKPCVQFSVIIKKDDGSIPIECEPSNDSLKAAEELLTNGTQLPQEVMVFYADSITNNWVNTRSVYTKVDNVIFAYN